MGTEKPNYYYYKNFKEASFDKNQNPSIDDYKFLEVSRDRSIYFVLVFLLQDDRKMKEAEYIRT